MTNLVCRQILNTLADFVKFVKSYQNGGLSSGMSGTGS